LPPGARNAFFIAGAGIGLCSIGYSFLPETLRRHSGWSGGRHRNGTAHHHMHGTARHGAARHSTAPAQRQHSASTAPAQRQHSNSNSLQE
jgi:hypothetical protein